LKIRGKEFGPDRDDLSVHETSLNEGESKYIDGFAAHHYFGGLRLR